MLDSVQVADLTRLLHFIMFGFQLPKEGKNAKANTEVTTPSQIEYLQMYQDNWSKLKQAALNVLRRFLFLAVP